MRHISRRDFLKTGALAAGLTAGAFYHAGDGIVRVVF